MLGTKPGARISIPPARPFAAMGSPSQPLTSPQADLHPGNLPTPTPPQPPALPIHPLSPLTMTFLSTGLFFSQFRCLLELGTRAAGGGVWGRGKVSSNTTSCLCPFWDNCLRGLLPFLPSPHLPGPPRLCNHPDPDSNAALLCDPS